MARIRGAFACVAALFMVLLTACGTTQSVAPAPVAAPTAAPEPTTTASTMSGMDHGAMTNAPFDAQFIDGMIMHHEGAIAMAKQAQSQAERSEIKQLAEAIITAQQAEITQMMEWRSLWYPDLAPTSGMGMDMGPMMISDGTTPFDQRFIEAMIPHHESAISMAKEAQQKAEHPEIKELASAIITAQEAEIAQMKQWMLDWFGVSQ
jgi:uncharacterized protein (DUF305 family)